ncbi:MAG: metallophosphoesterase [Pseudomonadota bacterium]
MRFAHFTDLHLPIRSKPKVRALLNKRILGYQSWLRKRHKRHQQWTLDHLVADARTQAVDAALISGDITNIALPDEFSDAADWMAQAMRDLPAVMVPGNHDSYVDVPWSEGMGRLAPYMLGSPSLDSASSAEPQLRKDADDFPFMSALGLEQGICCICANSAPPTAPGLASGRLGDRQIALMASMLEDAARCGHYRLIMLHHPVTDGVVSWRKGLGDAADFQAMIARVGADLIIHGHTHFPVHGALPGPDGPVTVIGGGSASHTAGHGRYTPARYNIIDIDRVDAGWSTQITIRELDIAAKIVRSAASGPAAALAS